MKTKKQLIYFIFLFIGSLFAEDLQLSKNEKFFFSIKKINLINNEKIYSSLGTVIYNKGVWDSDFWGSFLKTNINDIEYNKDEICIDFQVCNYFSKGTLSYREWVYPEVYKIILNKEIIEKIKKQYLEKDYFIYEIPPKMETSFGCASGISICSNLRVREFPNTNSSTKVLTKLEKWQTVQLIDCTYEKSDIEGLNYPWYKCKTSDGIEGWVFGGFVKIYTDNKDIELLKKAFEKEGSEYTNQFITPDYS